MSAVITIFDKNRAHKTIILSFEANTPEYIIADESFRLSILYAREKASKMFNTSISGYEIAEVLKDIDYEYQIKKGE